MAHKFYKTGETFGGQSLSGFEDIQLFSEMLPGSESGVTSSFTRVCETLV